MTVKLLSREDWLRSLVAKLAPDFRHAGHDVPVGKVRVSCGWPSVGALRRKARRIGECWTPKASKDGAIEIFVSPVVDDAIEAGGVLVHELVHAVVGVEHGHKAPFARLAKSLGLTGKMTATVPGDELKEKLGGLVKTIGPYPHAMLDATQSTRKKQSTRMVKVECPECGYTVRTTRRWLMQGMPTCPCRAEMEPVGLVGV